MGKHSKPVTNVMDVIFDAYMNQPRPEGACPEHTDGVHYYGAISIDEGECRCGKRIRQNNSGH